MPFFGSVGDLPLGLGLFSTRAIKVSKGSITTVPVVSGMTSPRLVLRLDLLSTRVSASAPFVHLGVSRDGFTTVAVSPLSSRLRCVSFFVPVSELCRVGIVFPYSTRVGVPSDANVRILRPAAL